MASSRSRVIQLLQSISGKTSQCPAHGSSFRVVTSTPVPPAKCYSSRESNSVADEEADYAYQVASSNIRYGPGVTAEVGMDVTNMRIKKLCVFTDKTMAKLPPFKSVLESLYRHRVDYEIYDEVRIEPTDTSCQSAIDFCRRGEFDGYVAVGGGSVIDTCKAANLLACFPEAELLDFMTTPIGKGLPVTCQLKPLIAVPTTSGTGSETTGAAVFDYTPLKIKLGIFSRALNPVLGIVDPVHTMSLPERIAVNSGFDVLCHALESYTALPYNQRKPRPQNPSHRPAYQGSNPISDIWSLEALRAINKYFQRSVADPNDFEARSNMHLASTFAGAGFGNAGCHLCHGMSYPISGHVKTYEARGYDVGHPLIPHGLSVVVTAPAVFEFTAPLCPERHIVAAEILGVDVANVKRDDAGKVLSDRLRQIMFDLKIDNGLTALGYAKDDVPDLVKGTLPQHRVTKLCPRPQTEEDLTSIFEESLTLY